MRKIVCPALLFLTLLNCKSLGSNTDSVKSKTVVKVGDIEINDDMVKMRAMMVEDEPSIKYPELVATAQLVQGMLASSVSVRYGRAISEASVKEFWKAAKKHAPQKLVTIEAKAKNKSFFLITMVLPDFATLAVHDIYNNTDEPHSEKIELTQRILTKVINNPEKFERVAMEERLSFDQIWIANNIIQSESEQRIKVGKVTTDPSKVITDAREFQNAPVAAQQGSPGYSDAERAVASELYRQLGATPAGQVHPRPIQTPDAFQLIKVEKREHGRAKISLITIDKLSFDEWYWKIASNISVEFTDVKMGEHFLQEVPWGRKLFVREELYPTVFPKRAAPNINRQNQFPYPPLP